VKTLRQNSTWREVSSTVVLIPTLSEVQGVVCLLSAAEMLQTHFSGISVVFLRSPVALCENFRSFGGQLSEDIVSTLHNAAQFAQIASFDDLETFDDCLITAGNTETSSEFLRLVYFAYCATFVQAELLREFRTKSPN
jgi:hypothetical protein